MVPLTDEQLDAKYQFIDDYINISHGKIKHDITYLFWNKYV